MSDERTGNSSGGHGRGLLACLAALGVASAFIYGFVYLVSGEGNPPPLSARLVLYPALFAFYFVAAYMLWLHRSASRAKWHVICVLACSVLFRGLVLSGPVAKNNDTWRYLWEGRVALEGINPYSVAPGDDACAELRDKLDEADDPIFENLLPKLNTVRSVYGPIATGLFVVPHWLPLDRIWSCRLIMTVFDFATILVLMGMLRTMGRPTALALIYAWNPMLMSGYADRAHVDAPMVFFLALAAWLMVAKRPAWAGVAFAASMLVKMSPLWLLLPFIRKGRLRFTVPCSVLCAVGAIPLIVAGEGALSGFREFGSRWHNMDSIHALVLLALTPLKANINQEAMARALMLVAMPAYAFWRTFGDFGIFSGSKLAPGAHELDSPNWLLRASRDIAVAGLLLSPVVHPWYTAHALIFLCFAPSVGMVLLTCATMAWFLKFLEPEAGTWLAGVFGSVKQYREPWRWVAYAPPLALLIWEWLRGWRRRSAGDGAQTPERVVDAPPPS